MRGFASVLNVALILTFAGLLYDKGMPDNDEAWIVALMFLAPVVSTVALWLRHKPGTRSLLSLYLQRKRLEEEDRIRRLQE